MSFWLLLLPCDMRCQNATATLGSYPAMAAKISPMRSASVSLSREYLRLLNCKPFCARICASCVVSRVLSHGVGNLVSEDNGQRCLVLGVG